MKRKVPRLFNRLLKPILVGLLRLVFLMLLILQLSIPAQALPQQQAPPLHSAKKILLLYTYGDGLPAYRKATPAFLSAITAGGVSHDHLFFEYLDLQRNKGAEYRQRLANLLRYKYARHQVGLIVTVHTEALNFLLNEGKELFPDAPVLSYLIVRSEMLEAKDTGRRILQRPQNLDVGGTLEIALKMFPETRKVVFVSGSGAGDLRLEREAMRIFEPWRDKLEFDYTSDRSVEEILQLVGSLPPRSIVIYCNLFLDKTGRTFTPLEVGSRVAKAANAPVFCLWDTLLGSGVIGGSLLSFEAEGAHAGNVALDILNGKILLTKPVTTLTSSKTFMFDWRQLRRWNLSVDALPKGSIIVNREFTLWDLKYYIVGALAFCLLETALIIFLIVQRRRKKAAEEELRQKEEELDQFFNISLDLLCIANTNGYFQRLNPAWERILGYTREELMARRFFDFLHPEDLNRTREVVSTLASQQNVVFFENRYSCKDGTYRWLEWTSAPAGNLIYAGARDITERKQAEETLRESEERLKDITFSMADWVWEVDENGVYTYSSQKGFDLLGRSREEIIGKTPFDFMPPDEAKRVAAIFSEIVANKAPIKDLENWNIRKNGESICLLTNGVPILDEEGNLKGYRGVDKDITERKRAEEALQESEEAAKEMAREASVLAEISRIISSTLNINEIYERFAAEAKKIIPFDRILINMVDSEKRTVKNVYISGVGIQDREVGKVYPIEGSGNAEMLRTKSTFLLQTEDFKEYADRFPMLRSTYQAGFRSIMNVPLFSEGKIVGGLLLRSRKPHLYKDKDVRVAERIGDQIAGAISITQLFQELKRAEEELRKYQEHLEEMIRERTAELVMATDLAEAANKAKSIFLANMSHELRTPLNSILGIAQLMERDHEFPQIQREFLGILSRSGKQLFELIDDLLEMSKIEAGQTTLVSTTFDLYRFLDDLAEMMILRAEEKNLALVVDRDSGLPRYIKTDARKLRQVLINLLANAIKFTETGRVALRIKVKEGMNGDPGADPALARLAFEIEDTGIGIAPEDRAKIFEPFVQLDAGRRAREGTGLGLALSRKFAALLGGEISVRSEVGRGSIFRLDIGVQLAEGADLSGQADTRRVIGLTPGQLDYRVLVVDDNLESRLLFRQLLEPVGFGVLEAGSGQEAVDLYSCHQPHLIWMDIRMPGMDGYEAAQRIREAERRRRKEDGKEMHTPIIALTAGVMEDKESSPLSWVFDDWAYKPLREAEIFGKMEKHLGAQFVYQPSVLALRKEEDAKDEAALTPADLAVLPAEWLRGFLQTLKKGRSGRLMDQIDRIRPEHDDLGRALAELVRVHQFDT